MDELYKAISDPTRRAILDELVERDGQSLFEICGRLAMKHGIASTRQAISQHLESLEAAGLVRVKREGRYKFHWFDGEPLKSITERWPAKTGVKKRVGKVVRQGEPTDVKRRVKSRTGQSSGTSTSKSTSQRRSRPTKRKS